MKTVAIHQPHYFPWLGYLDKMAKVDEFIVLDEVQLTDGSPMLRNSFLQLNGESKLLSLSVSKDGYLDKQMKDIKLVNWDKVRKKHKGFLECNYKKTPGFDDVMEQVLPIFEDDYRTVFDVDIATMKVLRSLYSITTPIVLQSDIGYTVDGQKSDLVLELCKREKADVYLSGRGAKSYMKNADFEENGIKVLYQCFSYPFYPQYRQKTFVANLCALDLMFQQGIERGREVFYENIEREDLS